MMRKYIGLSGILLLYFPCALYAPIGDGGTYGAFLSYWGSSARALGMAGAVTGLADDASAGYFNPAGLVQLNTQQVSFMHSVVFSGIGTSANVLMYARPINTKSGFGATIFHIHTPGIPYRPPGSLPTDTATGEYANQEITGLLTYCTRLIDPVWIGINGKVYNHQLHEYNGFGFGGDVGLFFFPGQAFSLGVNVQNAIKPSITLMNETNKFATVVRMGISIRPWREKFVMVSDMIWSEYRRAVFGVGLEYKPIQMLQLRAGCNESFATAGLGLWKDMKSYELQMDYAVGVPHQAANGFGYAHNISLSVLFGGYRAKAYCPTVAFSPTLGKEDDNIAWLYLNIAPRTLVEKWQVVIKDEIGVEVKNIAASGEPPYRIAWDGTDENSVLVPDGKYYYTLKVTEKDGRIWDFEGFLAFMYYVTPAATTTIRSKDKKPIEYIEEPKEEKKTTDDRRRQDEEKKKKDWLKE